jgi:hypothetical protein
MQESFDTVFAAAMALPEGERLDLAVRLLDSMPEPPVVFSEDAPNFLEELERRAADETDAIPWQKLKSE